MKKFKFNEGQEGFTLIELLVVIAIIGILGAIVYAPFQTARRKGRDGQRIVEMKNLQTTLYLYSDAHGGTFPENLAILQASSTDNLPGNANLTSTEDLRKYNYASYKDTDSGNIVGFHIWTHLETASPALSGAARCKSVNTDNTTFKPDNCITIANWALGADSVNDGASQAHFASSTRSTDTDSNCASDMNSCIFDLKS